jgi:hypothetical protein
MEEGVFKGSWERLLKYGGGAIQRLTIILIIFAVAAIIARVVILIYGSLVRVIGE